MKSGAPCNAAPCFANYFRPDDELPPLSLLPVLPVLPLVPLLPLVLLVPVLPAWSALLLP
jgi:hypothetical protein